MGCWPALQSQMSWSEAQFAFFLTRTLIVVGTQSQPWAHKLFLTLFCTFGMCPFSGWAWML